MPINPIFMFKIDDYSYRSCVHENDTNMAHYGTKYEKFEGEYIDLNENYDIIKLYFFNWFEKRFDYNCITRFTYKFIIPNDNLIINIMEKNVNGSGLIDLNENNPDFLIHSLIRDNIYGYFLKHIVERHLKNAIKKTEIDLNINLNKYASIENGIIGMYENIINKEKQLNNLYQKNKSDNVFNELREIRDIIKYLLSVKELEEEKFYDYIKKNLRCENISADCKNSEFAILNDFVIGDPTQYGLNKTFKFSFGSPFIDIGNNKLLGVGHIKIDVRDKIFNQTGYVYDRKSVPYLIRERLLEFMSNMFGDSYRLHLGSACDNGLHYLSYFMLWDQNEKTFKMSDFFLTIDLNDKYHFSIIFSIGLFLADFYAYGGIYDNKRVVVTSGEGDYYSNILTFKLDDVINACHYSMTSKDFDLKNINFCLMIKDLKDNIRVHAINDMIINDVIDKYKTLIKNPNADDDSDNDSDNGYSDNDYSGDYDDKVKKRKRRFSSGGAYKKYLTYKSDYFKIKSS